MTAPARALTIAGSDSGGGAGIQADLKTFAAHDVYGASAIAAVTAQNTLGVRAVQEMPPGLVASQIDAVLEDIGADAVKTGMLASAAIISAVAERVRHHGITQLVVDPVMVAKSGDRLLTVGAVQAMRTLLLPVALVVTPNIPEAEVLAEHPILTGEDMAEAARRIGSLGARYVLIKGGHLPGAPVDRLWDGERLLEYPGERVDTSSTHGTGCTLSAAITAHLARGADVPEAVRLAKDYVVEAMRRAVPIGRGHGPLHHLWPLDVSQG